tara:strand:+ start:132262 stop:132990 length:729 start_codon:yes stop_codon:yes gene_type:complete
MRNSSGGKHSFGYSTQNIITKQPRSSGAGNRTASGPAAFHPGDIIDVEFEHVEGKATGAKPPQKPPQKPPFPDDLYAHHGAQGDQRISGERLTVFSNGVQPGKPTAKRPSAGFMIVLVALCLGAFWFSGGHVIATYFAGASRQAGQEGLVLSDIEAGPHYEQSGSYLLLHGTIRNNAAVSKTVPLVTIQSAADDRGATLHYVRAPKKQLNAGESVRFRVRVPSSLRNHDKLTISLAGAGSAS